MTKPLEAPTFEESIRDRGRAAGKEPEEDGRGE